MVAPTQHEIELVPSDIKAAVLDFMRQEEMRQSELRNKSTARFTTIASLGAAAIIAAIVSIGQWYLNVLQSTIKADAASAARIAALDEIQVPATKAQLDKQLNTAFDAVQEVTSKIGNLETA